MTDKFTHIDEKIHQLKKKREKVQAQHALSFMKETQKIFKEEFSAPLALTVLTECWGAAPETKKENWKKVCSREGRKPQTFPSIPLQSNGKKVQEPQSADHSG